MSNKFIPQTLSSVFPTWTAKQIADFTAFMQSNSKELNAIDPEFMLTNLHDSITLAQKTYGKVVAPGLLREIYKNEALRRLKKRKKENNLFSPIDEFGHKLEESFGDFDKPNSLEKIQMFIIAVRKSLSFSSKENVLFNAIEEVANNEVIALANTDNAWKPSDFWKKVKDKLAVSDHEINEAYFRKLKQRVVDKLKELAIDKKPLLHLINQDEKEQLETLTLLLDLNTIPNTSFWSAYRYSTPELEKIITLKKLFEENGYVFNPDRFPEVYYIDYEVYQQRYPEHETEDQESIDYLGVYVFNVDGENTVFTQSQEGTIVLFKDRIENYCSRHSVSEDAVRFVVLMHELGHWLSHWSIHENQQWSLGFHLPNKRTKEALAQLIAYWACDANPVHSATLNRLSPKNDKGEVDSTAIYGGYIALVGQLNVMVLQKLAELRKFWMLKDEKMMEFLLSDHENVKTWMGTLTLSEPEKPYIDLVSPYFLENYKDTLESDCMFYHKLDELIFDLLKIEYNRSMKGCANIGLF